MLLRHGIALGGPDGLRSRARLSQRLHIWFIVLFLVAIGVVSSGAHAHPLHSEAIERPCQLHTKNEKASSKKGRCLFFVAGGYLIFKLDMSTDGVRSKSKIVSGAINLAQATGSVFMTGGGQLAHGAVSLAEQTPEIIHMKPGVLASWANGIVLEVKGSPVDADRSAGALVQKTPETVIGVLSKYLVSIIPRGFILKMPAPLTLVGLGLLLGLHGGNALKWACAAFFVMMVAVPALSMGYDVFIDPKLPMLLLALIAGLYAAGGLPLAPLAATGLGVLGGYFLGVFIAPSPAGWSTQAYTIAVGVIAASFLLAFVGTAVGIVRARWQMPWITIGLRVFGSWIAAIAALMTALSIR